MLVQGSAILNKAHREAYAVPAFNVNNLEFVKAVFEAANIANSPVFIQASEGAIKYAGGRALYAMVKTLSDEYPHIPVALHLDHGTTLNGCVKAIQYGFTSVMIDASHHKFDENLAITKKVVDIAHSVDVSVEAELGRLVGIEDNIVVSDSEGSLVDVNEAEKFVKETKVDYLAPAIGTSHGAFKFKGEPVLDFDRLTQVKKRCDIPLVLHGASSIPDYIRKAFNETDGDLKGSKGVPFDFIVKAIEGGINKINIDTDLRIAFTAEIRRVILNSPSEIDIRKFLKPAMNSIVNLMVERMGVLKSAGKI